jgi:hypothetical protein
MLHAQQALLEAAEANAARGYRETPRLRAMNYLSQTVRALATKGEIVWPILVPTKPHIGYTYDGDECFISDPRSLHDPALVRSILLEYGYEIILEMPETCRSGRDTACKTGERICKHGETPGAWHFFKVQADPRFTILRLP